MGGGAPHALYIRLVIEMEPKALKIVGFSGGGMHVQRVFILVARDK